MSDEKYKELKEYCEKMRLYYAEQSMLFRQDGRDEEADKEQRLSDFCDHLLQKMAS